jgi:hypothetical protein
VGYLFGDSTESGLDFNYLAFLREAVDCAVALVECDLALANIAERKRAREREMEAELAAIVELGRRATDLVHPVARDQKGVAVGRCAAAITTAIREAVERESAAVRATLAGQREELDKDGLGVNTRAHEALEKLLRTHDLPVAEKVIEVVWTTSGVDASLTQRTGFGVEAVVALDVPPGSLFTPDLRVEQVAPGIEVHAREAGGWIKKSDKLVTHKLGRYHITAITIDTTVRIQLRDDTHAGELTITAPPNGDIEVDGSGGGTAREITIEERDRAGLRAFVDKLEAATRELAVSRGRLVSIELEKKVLGEDGNARRLAERLMSAVAPTVHKIKAHSRNPDELVLRRLLGDNRREETFVPIVELVHRFEVLPLPARAVFAPLQLKGEAAMPARSGETTRSFEPTAPEPAREVGATPPEVRPGETKPGQTKPVETKPGETKPVELKAPSVPMPDRTGSRTAPPPDRVGTATPPPLRSKEPTQPFGTPRTDPVVVAPPPPLATDLDDEEWPAISSDDASDKPVSTS